MSSDPAPPIDLEAVAGPYTGRHFHVARSPIVIGRGIEGELDLALDSTVSKRHARLVYHAGSWRLEDLGSKNGIHVDAGGTRVLVTGSIPIEPGQIVVLGSTALRIADAKPQVRQPGTAQRQARLSRPSAPAPPPAIALRIALDGGDLVYQIDGAGPSVTQFRHPFNETDRGTLLRRLAIAVSASNAGDREVAGAQFDSLGELLRDQIVPQRVHAALEPVRGAPLKIVHDAMLADIPWELALLGGTPWCLAFDMARQIVLRDQSPRAPARAGGFDCRLLMVCNPTGDLRGVQESAQCLFRALIASRPDLPAEWLAGDRVTRSLLLERVARADIVYYLGHAEFDPIDPQNSAWLLRGDRVTCRHFNACPSPPRLVIANACESSTQAPSLDGLAGLAGSMILAGVQSYLGAAWPIPAYGSAAFGERVVQDILAGETLGRSVREARLALAEIHDASPALWGGYVLYGDPGSQFL